MRMLTWSSSDEPLFNNMRSGWWESRRKLSVKGVGWTARTPLFPIPKMELAPPIHTKLNSSWNTRYDRKQWYYKFSKIWSNTIPPKVSTHMWLIKHQGLWMGAKALRVGIGDDKCRRCRTEMETIHHLFMGCKHNSFMLSLLNRILGFLPSCIILCNRFWNVLPCKVGRVLILLFDPLFSCKVKCTKA